MAGASNKFDMSAAMKWFDSTIEKIKSSQELANALGMLMVNSTIRRFEEGVDPSGNPWEPSARAKAEGSQTLIGEGAHLYGSITCEASPNQIVWGTNKKYGAIHQYGGEIKAKSSDNLKFKIGGKFVSVSKVTMPKREYLGWNEDDLDGARDLISDFMKQAMGVL